VSDLRDPAIRDGLVEHLRSIQPAVTIVHEVGMRWHSVRADVVAVADDALHGFEIKSDGDSFARLRWQVKGYDGIFDFSTIVLTQRHLAKARVELPASWGILVAETIEEDGVHLRQERLAGRNEKLDPKALVRQLWRDDVVAMLRSQGIATRPRELVGELWDRAEVLPIDVIREHVRAAVVAHGDAREDLKERQAEARADRARRNEVLAIFVAKLGEQGAPTG
jgi:hypothetical protein